MEKNKAYIENLKSLWINGKTEECLDALNKYTNEFNLDELHSRSIILATRFQNCKKEHLNGLITTENFNIKKNNLTNSFLSICREISKPKTSNSLGKVIELDVHHSIGYELTTNAQILLLEASEDIDGKLMAFSTMDGWSLQTSNKELFDNGSLREKLEWQSALEELYIRNMFTQSKKRHSVIYQITLKGFDAVKVIRAEG